MQADVSALFLKRALKAQRSYYQEISKGFPGGSVVRNLPANAGDTSSILGWGRSLEEGNGNPLQYSCLGNSTDRGAWWVTAHGVVKSHT